MADYEPPSSPPGEGSTPADALAWYKSQYEQLELELADFRTSSQELEQELEKDLDAAEKRERGLQEKAEALGFEVDEWKRKYKESKAEANAAQNTLEKEITSLRDANRTLQMRLRDTEVANDDYERQARNTTSSLEDLESKYNSAIERAVLMEEEIKIGEQEREKLRIEAQRLREELSDLKIEAEILQDKIKKQEQRHLSAISTDLSVPESPMFDHSPISTASSPLITTPPDESSMSLGDASDMAAGVQSPPSPPMSDASLPPPRAAPVKTPAATTQRKSRLPSADHSITPKPKQFASSISSRAPGTRAATTSAACKTPASRPTTAHRPGPAAGAARGKKIPSSTSLSHIRSLTAQMQRLEARVQSVRSKLPAPVSTPPRASPRSSVITSGNVTIRSRKRTVGSTASSVAGGDEATPTNGQQNHFGPSAAGKHVPRLSTSGVSRLSFGPLPNRGPGGVADSGPEISRPSSRASISSYARPASRTDHNRPSDFMPPPRPMSRASLGGARTPLGRPVSRSSLRGSVHGHGHSSSVSYSTAEVDEILAESGAMDLRAPSRRGTYSRYDPEAGGSGLPPPSSIPMPGARRQSGGAGARRTSGGSLLRESIGGGKFPPASKLADVSDLGETY